VVIRMAWAHEKAGSTPAILTERKEVIMEYLILFIIGMCSTTMGVILGITYATHLPKKKLRVARLMPDVPRLYPPAHMGDAGYDLRCSKNVIIPAQSTMTLPTGLVLEIPKGYEGQIRGRSGLAKIGISTHVGTVDSSYRGQVGVIICNTRDIPWDFNKGDRVAQLVISKVETPNIEEVDRASMIPTERGEDGFGSTGIA